SGGRGPRLSAARAGGGRPVAAAGARARPALGVPAVIGALRAAFHRRLRQRASHLAWRIVPHLPTGPTVLDIGSRTGPNAEAPRARGARTCIEADVVDFHVVGDGPVLFDGARLPFADRVFDACLLAFVLSYADNPATLLREAGRVASRRVLVVQSIPRGRA